MRRLLIQLLVGLIQGGKPVAIGRIIPALKIRLALLGKSTTRFHQVILSAVLVQLCGKMLQRCGDAWLHLAHHVDSVHARRWGQRQQVLGHVKGCGQEFVRFHEAIEESHLIQALGREAKSQGHLGGNGMRESRQKTVIVAAE
jgi:hypothetical protein